MSDELPRRRSLDSLKKEAKRWLDALRVDVADVRARLARAPDSIPAAPTLRDVQHALAREHGFAGWTALKQVLIPDPATSAHAIESYEEKAQALLDAYRTGTPEALERHYGFTWHRRAWPAFGLNLDDSALPISARGFAPLVSLPHLGRLAVDAKDDWMPYIADMPALRFLGAQDTTADDDGFVELGKSQSIEYIWGRRCHNLRTRGFTALGKMPKLRGLSVSCLNVGEAGISMLPDFPALRELMPMDIRDAGYRHIGRCRDFEALTLMYCRDTTDAATEHITRLSKLTRYFNSYTTITDRTPALLSTMDSLEQITFDACHNLTNTGITMLARLPRLSRRSRA